MEFLILKSESVVKKIVQFSIFKSERFLTLKVLENRENIFSEHLSYIRV